MRHRFRSTKGFFFSTQIGNTLPDVITIPEPYIASYQAPFREKLQLDEPFVNALYNGLTEAILAVHFGTRVIVHWNKGAEAMFGYTAEEVLGKTTEILYPDYHSFENISQLATPKILKSGRWQTEWEYRRRDGTSFPAEVVATMIEGSEGSQFYVIVIRDISVRKQSEAAFRDQSASLLKVRQRLQTVLDHTTMVIYVLGSDGKLRLVNKRFEELFHVDAANIAGTPLQGVFDKQTADLLLENNAEVLATETTMRFEESIPQADGRHTYVSVKVPLYDECGVLYAVCATCTDITEQKRDQETIEKLNKELESRVTQRTAELERTNEQLRQEIVNRRQAEEKLLENERLATVGLTSAKLAHEIANPLQSMVSAVELLEQSLSGNGEIPLDAVRSSVHELAEQINLVLSFLGEFKEISRPSKLQLLPIDLFSLVRELLTLEASYFAKQGVRIEENLSTNMSPVEGDAAKLKQALLNLFKNSVEAMPNGGILSLRGYRQNKALVLEVADTGVGIPESFNIFGLFITSKPMGTGLGLPIAKDIVTAHHGTLSYTTERDKGTTFKLELPLLESAN